MNEFQHRVTEQERVLTVIESPRHFVKVGCKMLRANSMPRAGCPTLRFLKGG